MKKFLIFLVSIVVVVCLGMTTYYFLRNDETINFKTKEIYCNTGDVITLSELGFVRTKAHKGTEFNYNAGGDAVTQYVNYDANNGYYVVGTQGGDVTIVITTSNKKFAEFKITLHIGDGSESNPYYIDDEATLAKIGVTYGLDKSYSLMNDITVSNNFKPIGLNTQNNTWDGFSGKFNGNGYSINGLNLTATDYEDAGLFSSVNAGASVTDLTIKNATINGSYNNIGVVAGTINGSVNRVAVQGANITSKKLGANIGAFAGTINQTTMAKNYAENVTISAQDASNVGGFVGVIDRAMVQACYTSKTSVNGTASNFGGFVGKYVIGTNEGSIQQSYANTTSTASNFGSFAGEVAQASNFVVADATMLRYLIGNVAVGANTVNYVNVDKKEGVDFFPTNFIDTLNGYYLITTYATENDLILATDIVFYAMDENTKTSWDDSVWFNANNTLPQLRMNTSTPSSVDGAYLRRSLTKYNIDSTTDLKAVFTNAVDKEYVLKSNITLPADWTAVNISNCNITGNSYSITFSNGESLFNVVDNCSIKDITLKNVALTSTADKVGALASEIKCSDSAVSSNVDNVNVEYTNSVSITAEYFGGLVGYISNTNISNVSVTGLVISSNANVNTVGGIIGAASVSRLVNVTANAELRAKLALGGIVGSNYSLISNAKGNVNLITENNVANSYTGGIVGWNGGQIYSSNITVRIDVENIGSSAYVGGVAGLNESLVNNVTLKGNGIIVNGDFTGTLKLGGIAGSNAGQIQYCYNYMSLLGTYMEGKNHVVGGVTAENNSASSEIYQCVVSSSIQGNIVAGVTVYMNGSQSATVNQVLVANFNPETDAISENDIKGDQYVAGICFDFRGGTISNIQTKSRIIGATNATRSSLVVMIFPDGAKLNNSTIDSSFFGSGTFYLDTWRDFREFENKSIFGFANGVNSEDGSFNLYDHDVAAGSMQSVVINAENANKNGVNNIIQSYFVTTPWLVYRHPSYSNSDESSFYKVVSNADFNNASTFKTDWSYKVAESGVIGLKEFGWTNRTFTKSMTFNFGVWAENSGIRLAFLATI